jgi:hypothetical protein
MRSWRSSISSVERAMDMGRYAAPTVEIFGFRQREKQKLRRHATWRVRRRGFPTCFELARLVDSCKVTCIGAECSFRCLGNPSGTSCHYLVLVAIETRKPLIWCRNPMSTRLCTLRIGPLAASRQTWSQGAAARNICLGTRRNAKAMQR